ncbi:SH3 domain-containing protein [Bacillus wiedmannii]|uniref:SH3 domain-containing protein n=2 Tax=Bacillus cereus group TaxID=86661 RepID=UPI000B4B6F31|nr:SH3 domain-containing protein [Bacillus wiedmannii]
MKQTTKQIITGTFLATATSFISTHAFAESDNLATVNATNLNIREQPTTQGKVIGTVKKGTNVQVLSKEKEWAKISHDGKEGYVTLQFLGFSNGNPNVEQKQQLTINNGQKEEGIVTATRLNVRNSPALGSSMIGYVQKNEKVTVLGKANGWAKIEYKGKEGYVSLEFLKFGDAIQTPDTSDQKQLQPTIKNGAQEVGTINATSLRVRSAANTSSSVLGNLKNGEKVTVLGKANGWAKISYQGKEGYVSLEFVKIDGNTEEIKKPEQPKTSDATIRNGTQEVGTINATSLRVRSAANTSSSVLGNLKNGEKVTVLGKANGWAKISYQGKEGYVSLEFVKIDGNTEEVKTSEQPKTSDATIKNGTQEVGTINATSLRVRSAANTSSSVLGNLKNGEKVTVLGKANGWAKISYQGKEGYVSLEFVKLEAGKQEEKPAEDITNGTQEVGTINATSLRVRSAANTSSSILGNLKNGEKVTVLGKANGWAKISYQGKEGYVSLEFVKLEAGKQEEKPAENITNGTQEVGTINATSLRVRSAANTSSSILGNLKNGEKVTVLGKANGWAKISYQGKEGYVSLEFVKLEAGKQEEKPAENITNGTQEVGTINATSLRVRSAANTSSSILGNLKNGEKVTVLGKANGWAKISYQGKEGYVSLEFVKLEAGKQEEKPAENITNGTQEVGTINATSLRVRSAANTSSTILGTLKNGEKVTVLGKANGWAKISYQGKEGYVSLEFVKLEAGKQEEKPAEDITNGTQEVGTINATSLRVRSAANTSSTILGTLKNGEKVTVLGKANGWAKISYQGKEGYVSLEFITIGKDSIDPTNPTNPTNPGQVIEERAVVNASLLNVRKGPSTGAAAVGHLKNGETVTIIGKDNGWAKIRFNGGEGYVSLQFLKVKQGSSSYEIVTSSQKVQKPNEAEATQIMQNMKEDAYIKSDGKVVNMKQGFVRANGVINIYDITTGKKLTYVKGGADLKFVKAVDDRIHVQIDGMTGYVNINDVTLHPTMTGEKTSYYATKNGKLYHYVYNPENGKHATYQIGNAPKHLKEGERYEAFDKKQIGGQDSYQYFEYMPLRATSTYTGDEIDNFLRKSNAKSPLIGLGKYFVSAAEKYKMNAGYLVSHAILESGWGTSRIAQDKKNLFGFRAVDSDPYNGATGFKTWEEGIDFCAAYIDKHYLNPSGNTYNGGNLGDKAQGMNVMYASDENWGQQIASLMYRIDAMNGSKDLNKYRLGTLTAGSPIFKSMAEGQTGMTSRNIMVAIKKTVNTPQGSYYEIVSDNKEYNSVYVKAGSVNLVNSY